MRYDTYSNIGFNMQADVWVKYQDSEGAGDIVFNFSHQIRCNADFGTARGSLQTDDQNIPRGSQIRNVRDFNGNLVTDGFFVVTRKVPQVNGFGFVEGWEYTISYTEV